MDRRSWLLLAVFLAGCGGQGCRVPTPTAPKVGPEPSGSTNGLEGNERVRWHHLAEGSELYPLSWLLALHAPNSDRPFLDNPERFGLLADPPSSPDNPFGLPIGVTVAFTKDLTLAGDPQMIGINCAACHVSVFRSGDKTTARIDGAPNLFDLELFYRELLVATGDNVSSVAKAWDFARRVHDVTRQPRLRDTAVLVSPEADKVLAAYKGRDLASLQQGNAAEKEFAKRLEATFQEAKAAPAPQLGKGLVLSADAPALTAYRRALKNHQPGQPAPVTDQAKKEATELRRRLVGTPRLGEMTGLADKAAPPPGSDLAKDSAGARAAAFRDLLTHFYDTVRLLMARVESLQALLSRGTKEHTDPGFGRVDAFGSARNAIFPDTPGPLTAPISYPHLFNLSQIDWFHWDANTTSLLERNVGQAIGLGAIFDRSTFKSSVLVDNIQELERLARKIQPPKWPEDVLGPIDRAKVDRGMKHFEKHCAGCHANLPPGGRVGDLPKPPDVVDTDALRADNFALPVGKLEYAAELARVLGAVTREAGGQPEPKAAWRFTKQYARRPLVGVWATAPYLHNNSVPTLYHLLAPDERPREFWVGSREYDAKHVGLRWDVQDPPSFRFVTTEPGNGNGGHTYGRELTPDQRGELLEYLKTL